MNHHKLLRIALSIGLLAIISSVPLYRGFLTRSSVSYAMQNPPDDVTCDLSSINDSIQQRFKDVSDNRFGASRLPVSMTSPHIFIPDNPKEIAEIKELKNLNLTVVLFLAGRGVFERSPLGSFYAVSAADGKNPGQPDSKKAQEEKQKAEDKSVAILNIKGPIVLTRDVNRKTDLPTAIELLGSAREAFRMFEHSDHYDFSQGNWKISARPVKINDESCLKCHKYGPAFKRITVAGDPNSVEKPDPPEMRVGDTIGVVFYAYRRSK